MKEQAVAVVAVVVMVEGSTVVIKRILNLNVKTHRHTREKEGRFGRPNVNF